MSERDLRARLPERLVRGAIRKPTRVGIAWLFVLLVSAVGVARLHIDTTTESVLDHAGEPWAFYQSSQARFGGDEIVVVSVPGDRPFDPHALAEVERLTELYQGLDGVRRVDSLKTVPLIRARPDGSLDLRAPLAGGVPEDAQAQERLAAELRADRIAPRSLVSPDERVFALNVILEQDFAGDYQALVGALRAELPEGARMSGVPVFRTEANARTRKEILLFVPLTVIAIGLLVALVYRSLSAVVIALSTAAVGTVVMAGGMGLAGVSISLITMILPSIVLALGCSYVMHVLSAAAGARDPAALEARLLPIALPVALSGLTTAIGFAVIGAVRIDEVRYVGAFGSLGVLALVACSLTVAPALLRLWPLPEGRARFQALAEGALCRTLVGLASRRRGLVLVGTVVVLACFGVGISRIEVVTDATHWFPRGSDVRDSYEAIRDQLSGISPVNVVLESRSGERTMTDPGVLHAIDGLSDYLESLPEVGKAISVADPLRQLHGGFAGDPSQPLPDTRPMAEQYLMLLESVEQIADVITPSRTAANIVLRADDNGSGPLLGVGDKAAAWWAQNGVEGIETRATGIMYEFARAEDEIAMGQVRGLVLALVAIAIVLLAALGSVRLALIALVPNVAPVLMVFGFMGLVGVPLDAGTVVVGSLVLGIAVDDTVHLVSAFQDSQRRGQGALDALHSALGRVLHPLVLTTVAVGLGFGLLGLSQFTLTRNLGLLVSGTMGVCLLADLVLLPALLRGYDRGLLATSSPSRK